jgi:hypothetical protein
MKPSVSSTARHSSVLAAILASLRSASQVDTKKPRTSPKQWVTEKIGSRQVLARSASSS